MADIVVKDQPASEPEPAPDDELGGRYVTQVGPDGKTKTLSIPLTLRDLLFPQKDDHAMHDWRHTRDFSYCAGTLQQWFEGKPGVVFLGYHRIDFGLDETPPMGPDICIVFDSLQRRQGATYSIPLDGGRPVFALEITSPSTRDQDFNAKTELYYQAGVERYVIVDRGKSGEESPRLVAFERGEDDWQILPPDDDGRVAIAPNEVLLGIEGDRLWPYHPRTKKRFLETAELTRRIEDEIRLREELEARADRESELRAVADAKATLADAKAKREEQLRIDADAKAKREEQMRINADAKAKREEQLRIDADKKAEQTLQTLAEVQRLLRELQQSRQP